MCGPPRPSSGGRIAVLFPAAPKASQINSCSILFTNPDAAATRAIFRGQAGLDLQAPIDLRIEYVHIYIPPVRRRQRQRQ